MIRMVDDVSYRWYLHYSILYILIILTRTRVFCDKIHIVLYKMYIFIITESSYFYTEVIEFNRVIAACQRV